MSCMVYLLKAGISLSPAVMIRPSFYESNTIIFESVTQRLFPYLSQHKEWVIVPESADLRNEAEALREHILKNHPQLDVEIKAFQVSDKPLGVLSKPKVQLSAFSQESFIISKQCVHMKRLNEKCFKEVSLHKSRRKFKELTKNHFMMTSYLDTHFLVLMQRQREQNTSPF